MNINSDQFQKEVLEYQGVVLADFWATWCGPCQMLSPTIEEIEKETVGKVKVVKIDVDSCPEIASTYNVNSIPTVIIFNHGQVVSTIIGLRSKQDYLAAISGL
ncbi:MAG TPA: thioredoxin [Candidatus Woesebacteria bacterium]|nr:thioredoxin [Candidatus Woesebacteria bacterium]